MRNRVTGILFAFLFLTFTTTVFLPGFSFAQETCPKSCVIHADCGLGGWCDNGSCAIRPNYCGNERWSVNALGETKNCDAYKCVEPAGLCLERAEKETDCTQGYVFDGTDRCVSSIQCDPTTEHCQDLLRRWQEARTQYEELTPEPKPEPVTCNHSDERPLPWSL